MWYPYLDRAVCIQHRQHDELYSWKQVGQTPPLPLELQVIQHHKHVLTRPHSGLEGEKRVTPMFISSARNDNDEGGQGLAKSSLSDVYDGNGSHFNQTISLLFTYPLTWGLLLISRVQSMIVLLCATMSCSPPASSMQSKSSFHSFFSSFSHWYSYWSVLSWTRKNKIYQLLSCYKKQAINWNKVWSEEKNTYGALNLWLKTSNQL